MYGVLPAVCCCDGEVEPPPPGTLYFVFSPCDYYSTYCCSVSPAACDDEPAQIIWCQWYAAAQGLFAPIPEGQCVLIKLGDCCVYQLSGIISSPCPNPPQVGQNTGTLFKSYLATEERPCCESDPVVTDETGCLYELIFTGENPWNPTPWVPDPCRDLIAVEYDKYDQYGTVAGKEVKIKTSELAYCYATLDIPDFVRCNDGDPIVFQKAIASDHIQLHGLCIPVDSGLGNCQNQRTEVFVDYLTCPECTKSSVCCGGTSACAPEDPNYDEYCEDPASTYEIKTCYSVNTCTDAEAQPIYFEQDVLYIDFPWCHSGIDPSDPDVQDLLDAFYIHPTNGVVRIGDSSIDWGFWGPIPPLEPPPLLIVCDYSADVISGNAKHLAQSINERIGDLVTASSIAPWDEYMWFGRRQTCTPCEAFDSVFPPYSDGDALVVDRVEPRSSGPRVYLVGRSIKKYVCVSKTISSLYSISGDVTTACISANGNADDGFSLHCLSPAEYSSGLRYSMRQIEQVGTFVDICVDQNSSESVVACKDITGGLNYPISDWQQRCTNILGPTEIKCRSYYHIYAVAPCDTSVPLPILCIAPTCSDCDSYQNSKAFCETEGSVIEII